MRRCGLAWLALALLLGGGVLGDEKKADKAEAVKQEYKRLNGTWECVRVVSDGKEVPLPKDKLTVTIKDGKYTVKAGKGVVEGTFKLDPTTNPKSLDGTPSSGPSSSAVRAGLNQLQARAAPTDTPNRRPAWRASRAQRPTMSFFGPRLTEFHGWYLELKQSKLS